MPEDELGHGFDPAPFSVGRLPRVLFGAGRFGDLASIVHGYGDRALFVIRPSFVREPAWEAAQESLRQAGVSWSMETESGEPSPELVDGLVQAHRAEPIGCVVGIGGGSVLDTAKAVAGLLRPGNSVTDHLEGVGPQLPYRGPATPFVAVPTTAGTGSEATRNAVLSVRGPGGYTKSFRDERLVAEVAIVDPDLLASCPPELIAADGMDAVTQLIESYTSTKATPFSDALAQSGLASAESLLVWHHDPRGRRAAAARKAMAWAALCSGICLAQAGLGAAHGLASPLGAMFPIPHGVACGAVLPVATRVNIRALESRGRENPALHRYAALGRLLAGGHVSHDAEGDARRELIALLENWRNRLGVPRLSAYGVRVKDIPAIVADSRGSSMKTNPITLTDAEIAEIVRSSL